MIAKQSAHARTLGRAVLSLGFAAWLVDAGYLLTGPSGEGTIGAAGRWLQIVALVCAAVVCVARPLLVVASRLAWALVASGASACAIGWIIAGGRVAPEAPPTAAAVVLALRGPLLLAGAVVLVWAVLPRMRGWVLADWLVAALGLATSAALGLEWAVGDAVGSTRGAAARVLLLSTPVADVLAIGLVAALASTLAWLQTKSWAPLLAALTVLAAADLARLDLVAAGAYHPAGSAVDALWPAAMLLLSRAAWERPPDGLAPPAHAPVRSVLLPVTVGAAAVVLLVVGNLRPFTGAQLGLAVATLACVAVRLAAAFLVYIRINRDLRGAAALAATDALTGLANHRTFHERLRAEVERAGRSGRPLSVVVLDIDHFKPVNDRFGHQIGDRLLVEVTRRLDRQVRGGDTLARVGGEEFAWLLPETDGPTAWAVAERARRAVADRPFAMVGRVTVSAGVCDLDSAAGAQDLFRLADIALYRAKHLGRDAVVRHEAGTPPLAAGSWSPPAERSPVDDAVHALAVALDARDPASRHHCARVASLAVDLALELGWTRREAALLHEAGLLHDLGKVGVSLAVLRKRTPLTTAEHRELRAHPEVGAAIASAVLSPEQTAWVRHHHDRWDRPRAGDAADATVDGADILAVSDAWDVMISGRSYRTAWDPALALAEIQRGAGSLWSPRVVAVLAEVVRRTEEAGGGPAGGLPAPAEPSEAARRGL